MKAVTFVVLVDGEDMSGLERYELARDLVADMKLPEDSEILVFEDDYEGPIPSTNNKEFFVGWKAGKAALS